MTFLPLYAAFARNIQPIIVDWKQISSLPEVGKLNSTPISGISGLQAVDIDKNGFDEIVCRCGDVIDFSNFSGHKLRRMLFPIQLYGWSILNVELLGGYCLFIFIEVDGWARMDVYDIDKRLLGSMDLCPVKDRDGSGSLDFAMEALDIIDLDGDHTGELIIRSHTGYDLYPRGLLVVDLQHWRIIGEYATAGNINDISFICIDSDSLPDFMISTYAPSNGAIVGDWDDSQSVLLGLRGFDGSVLWRRVIGGPLSWVCHHLIDLDGDGKDEVIVAESSEYAQKEHNTVLKVFQLPDGVEVCRWEHPDSNTLFDCFITLKRGKKSDVLVGFDDRTLVKFDCELNPSYLYRFPICMSFIQSIDLNGDGQKEVLIGLGDEQVLILDDELRLVGQQHFAEPPISVRTPETEFGEFVVISKGRVYGWYLNRVKLLPPPSRFRAWFQHWGLYIGIIVVLIIISIWMLRRRILQNRARFGDKAAPKYLVEIADFADEVFLNMGSEDVRKTICKEILSQRKGRDSFDYLIFLLGDVEIYNSSGKVHISKWRSVKWKALLCYLATNRLRRIHKERLSDLFWQDSKPIQAAQNLRLAIHRLNRELSLPIKGKFFTISDQCYVINSEYRLFVDVEEFERLILLADRMMKDHRVDRAIECYLAAIRLYKDDYLVNLYESWCDVHRGYTQKLYIHALKQIGQYLLGKNMPDKAIGYFKNALKIDDYSEELYVDIMRCHAACGNRKAIKDEYQHLLKLLQEDMNTKPLPETTRIYQSLIG